MSDENTIIFSPIGRIRSPFAEQEATPIQAPFAADVRATVEIRPEFRAGLSDLDGFDRIWLLYWLDRSRACKLRVVPYLDSIERGVFSTRAPSRPNPIGISCVRLNSVDAAAGILQITEVDILDGTPLLDVKPYVPRFDSFPDSKIGWLTNLSADRDRADNRFSPE